MQAVVERSSPLPKVIVFPKRMAAQAPIPPPEHGPSGHDPVVHGSKAAIAAAIFAGLAMVATFVTAYVNWSNRSDQKTQQVQQQADTHTNELIESKLNPAVKVINDHIDTKVGELSNQIHALDVRLARLEGPLAGRVSRLETRANQQASLAKILDPSRVLAMIRRDIQTAQTSPTLLPASDVNDYRNAIQALPTTANEYWTTAAAIINYQSYINQMSGEAPDPTKVSRSCGGTTTVDNNGNLSIGNITEGGVISGCIVDFGTVNGFQNVTFKDSVIRYQGGPVAARNVRFINCRFLLDLHNIKSPATYKPTELLTALLNSPDQKDIYIR
jgi:hypothetical protein